MSINLEEALQTFIIEGRELLEQMEAALLSIEQSPEDPDTINAIFRAAHTIKGSAGLFGLDHIVAFTHVAESVLDRVRNGELGINAELVALLLKVGDHLGDLLDLVAAGQTPEAALLAVGEQLQGQLRTYLGSGAGPTPAPPPQPPVEHVGQVEKEACEGVDADTWHISLRFGPDVLRHGMDPLAFIRYLGTFGQIVHMVTLTEGVPPLSQLDPETCHLGFEISYRSEADKETIAGAFEFVSEEARIQILPPHSKVEEYRALIDALPEEDLRLGEILMRCGTLTAKELEQALRRQAEQAPSQPIGEMLVDQHLVQPQIVEAALDKQKQVKEHKANENALIRVNAEKLDQHINLIGELIIASAGISLTAQRQGLPELLEAASLLSRLVEEVRDSALQLRMVQIGGTFTRFQRVVRDVSADLGKDIRLEISGAETELDKTVVEKIGDPLTHLVRNSMDHGIEAAEIRLARGKPAHGTLGLNAYHDSGSIVIEVSDDGGGLDKERILAKAREKGLVQPEQNLSDQEIYQLIFEPGFSTAAQVNNLSGRGVGMDVVRRNIMALRGSVEIDSRPGLGTTMRIRLPLTLAIIDGFLVGVGRSSFVIPLDMVVECIELTQEETEAAQGRDQLNLRGEVLPFVRLKQMFDIPEPPPEPTVLDEDYEPAFAAQATGHNQGNSIRLTAEGAAALAADPELAFLLHPVRRENIVVVQYGGRRAGLVVDQLQGEFQTVIRPLGEVFTGLQGISGFTILGSGQVALILDVPGLVRRVAERDVYRGRSAASIAAPR